MVASHRVRAEALAARPLMSLAVIVATATGLLLPGLFARQPALHAADGAFRYRDALAVLGELQTPLDAVPEVGLQDRSRTSRAHIAELARSIEDQDRKRADGFIEKLRSDRPDLAGLPFRLGAACRLDDKAAADLALASLVVRDVLASVRYASPEVFGSRLSRQGKRGRPSPRRANTSSPCCPPSCKSSRWKSSSTARSWPSARRRCPMLRSRKRSSGSPCMIRSVTCAGRRSKRLRSVPRARTPRNCCRPSATHGRRLRGVPRRPSKRSGVPIWWTNWSPSWTSPIRPLPSRFRALQGKACRYASWCVSTIITIACYAMRRQALPIAVMRSGRCQSRASHFLPPTPTSITLAATARPW